MGVINTGSFAKDLWPGIKEWYGIAYDEHKPEYTRCFKPDTSSRKYEEFVGFVGSSLAPEKAEGESIAYITMQQGFVKRFTHITYGQGIIITREAYEDAIWDREAKQKVKRLAFNIRQTKETVHGNIFNRAFNSDYAGADGKEMCATDHPNISGGTWSNELATAANLSEYALEQACIDIGNFTDDGGGKISVLPRALLIPTALEFDAARILKSINQNDTANNAINALRELGKFPDGVLVNHYLTDTNAWFILTNSPLGLLSITRRADAFTSIPENDFDTENAKFKATMRFSCGCVDPRAIYGSPGA